MDVAVNKTSAVFRTPFSDACDLMQVFSHAADGHPLHPSPVDFCSAALVRRSCPDIWHADRALALSTDEAPPMLVSGGDIGGNHGWECGVVLQSPAFSLADVGTAWQDGAGVTWTCLQMMDGGRALFVSENTGPSETDFAFAERVRGDLNRGEMRVPAAEQRIRVPLTPAIRHSLRRVEALRDGAWQPVCGGASACDMARILETYDILNPASVASAVRAARPEGGYSAPPELSAFGAPMLRISHIFTVHPDGTVVTELDHQALQPVRWQGFLALMYQEKCCPEGGRVLRYIPGVKPLSSAEGSWDFSLPVDLSGPFPRFLPVMQERWADPAWPPDRQIEMIQSGGGCVLFAAGILPVMDGAPDKRRENLVDALTLVSSRKSYLTFRGTGSPALAGPCPALSRVRGAVYRKYFAASSPDVSLYAVPFGGGEYLYADFMRKDGPAVRRCPLPAGCRIDLMQLCGDVRWTREGDALVLSGSRGFAAFRIHTIRRFDI